MTQCAATRAWRLEKKKKPACREEQERNSPLQTALKLKKNCTRREECKNTKPLAMHV